MTYWLPITVLMTLLGFALGVVLASRKYFAALNPQKAPVAIPLDPQTVISEQYEGALSKKQHVSRLLNIHYEAGNEPFSAEIERYQILELALNKSRNVLDAIFNASIDPIGIYTKDYQFLGGNVAFAQAMGVPHHSFKGKYAADLMDPEMLTQYQKRDKKVFEQGQTIKYEDLVITPDGSQVWYEVTKTQYRDSTDDTVGILMIARDVTARKATQQELADAIMDLEELSFIDGLTKVANRRSFDVELVKLWHSHLREQIPLSLIFCDIDYFKRYNDNYGHQQGDTALKHVADVFLRAIRRPLDLVARYGGEEFAILLPNTTSEGAKVVADNIAKELENARIIHKFSSVSDRLTLSQGIATIQPQHSQNHEDLVLWADKSLYRAKGAGRNHIICHVESHPDID